MHRCHRSIYLQQGYFRAFRARAFRAYARIIRPTNQGQACFTLPRPPPRRALLQGMQPPVSNRQALQALRAMQSRSHRGGIQQVLEEGRRDCHVFRRFRRTNEILLRRGREQQHNRPYDKARARWVSIASQPHPATATVMRSAATVFSLHETCHALFTADTTYYYDKVGLDAEECQPRKCISICP